MTEKNNHIVNQLPKDWKLEEFNEIANLIRGVSYDKQYAFSNPDKGLIPLMRATNIQKELVLEEFVYVPGKLIKEEQFIKEGDILLAMSSGSKELVGKAAQAKQDYQIGFGTFCGLIRPNDKIDKKFFGYFFQTRNYRHYVSSISKGIGINNLRRNHIEDLQIPLPPKPMQQAIVSKIEELFSELDKGIEQLKTAQQQLKIYRQSVLKWAFEGKLTRSLNYDSYDLSDEHDLPIAAEPEVEYGNSNGLPKGWKKVKLGDIAKKKSIKALPVDYPDAKFIGMDCIESHTLKPYFLYDFKEFKSAGNYFKKNQVLYGRMRPYLNKVYRAEFDGTCSGEFIILDCDEDFNPDLLKYILHSRGFVSFANSITTGDRPRISYEEIADYDILLPPIGEQNNIVQEIESRLSVADKMEESITQSLQQAEALRQSILKKAFEGALV